MKTIVLYSKKEEDVSLMKRFSRTYEATPNIPSLNVEAVPEPTDVPLTSNEGDGIINQAIAALSPIDERGRDRDVEINIEGGAYRLSIEEMGEIGEMFGIRTDADLDASSEETRQQIRNEIRRRANPFRPINIDYLTATSRLSDDVEVRRVDPRGRFHGDQTPF
jgi:hypothetical protein